ncbi:toll-like receptor 4 [Liolophura sinensis]|uniref:toll-like receptor 4 n=1 Tax=Liolophura sinensis TaxID=3198878 RepID=UPI0031581B75
MDVSSITTISVLVVMVTVSIGTPQNFAFHYQPQNSSLKPWICEKLCACDFDNSSGYYSGNCSHRQLGKLPGNLSSNFVHLDFSYNQIQSISAEAFLDLSTLLTLDLSSNHLSDLSEKAFTGLYSLTDLRLDGNKLLLRLDKPPFEPLIFADLHNLQSLHINNNSLSCGDESCGYPDSALGHLTNLQRLYMDGVPNTAFGPGFRNLTHLHTLDIGNENGNCDLPTLYNDTFTNLEPANLIYLRIQHCDVATIEPEAFRPLTNIHTIDLTWHHLTFAKLRIGLTGLSRSPIKVLRLIHLEHPGTELMLPERTFEALKNTTLSELIFTNNGVAQIEDKFLLYLPRSLENLDLSHNYMVVGGADWLTFIVLMKNLRSFNGSYQASGLQRDQLSLPFLFHEHGIVHPAIQGNASAGRRTADVVTAPPNLQYIYLQNNYLNIRNVPPLNFTQNNIRYADFSRNKMEFAGPLYGLHRLEYFDLSYAESKTLHTDFFSDMPSLKELFLQNNNLKCLGQDTKGVTFSANGKLKTLDLSGNGIETLAESIFSQQYQLQSLLLHTNYLTQWQVRIGHMTNLTFLDLGRNRLSTLDSSARNDMDNILQHRVLQINLRGNPLRCSCDNLQFLKWLAKQQEFFIDLKSYSCQISDKTNASLSTLPELIHRLELKCVSNTILIVSSVSLAGLLVILTLAGFVYRYRWHVRFFKNRLALRLKLYQPLLNEDTATSYNAFLSYEDGQHQFIVNTVYPKLELQLGFQLCIHTRDFTPGSPIAANIYRAVHYSKRTLTFLTKAYFESEWCVYELEMAYLESVHTGRQILVPVLMEQVDFTTLPEDLKTILKSLTYLDYTNMDEDQFFHKVAEILQTSENDWSC